MAVGAPEIALAVGMGWQRGPDSPLPLDGQEHLLTLVPRTISPTEDLLWAHLLPLGLRWRAMLPDAHAMRLLTVALLCAPAASS